jgi:calmodulin
MAQYQITPEIIDEYRQTFSLFDKDGDGHISADELGFVMRANGHAPTNEEVKAIIAEVDKNKSGEIEFDEFVQLMVNNVKADSSKAEEDVKQAFMVLDKDGDGFIPAVHLRRILTTMGEALTEDEVEEIIALADADGDGQITYEALVAAMTDSR